MSRDLDGYRIMLDNWSSAQLSRLQSCDFTLSFTSARKILTSIHLRLYRMRQDLWRTRSAGLGLPVFYPTRSRGKFYAVRIGRTPGLYYSHPEAEEQTTGFSGAEWKSFTSFLQALAYLADGKSSANLSIDSRTPSSAWQIYTDGSYTASINQAGWGFAVLHPSTSTLPITDQHPTHTHYGPVILSKTDPSFLGATRMSNNTGELTAIGEALRWISTHQPSDPPAVNIISDSLYALNVIQQKFKAKKNKALISRIQTILKSIPSSIPISFHWTKAHTISTTSSIDLPDW